MNNRDDLDATIAQARLDNNWIRDRRNLQARMARLEAFVREIADHGLRCDMTPTRVSTCAGGDCDLFYCRYFGDAVARRRAQAKEALR